MVANILGDKRITVGADKGYHTEDFVRQCRANNFVPHVTQKRDSTVDAHTTRHEGYAASMRKRKRIEEIFGWQRQSDTCARFVIEG